MNHKFKSTTGTFLLIRTNAAIGIALPHAIARRKARENFMELSRSNYEHVLSQMAPRFDHYFSGPLSLGGGRRRRRQHQPETMRRWFERLYRLNRNLSLDSKHIRERHALGDDAAVEWIDRAKLINGEPYEHRWSFVSCG